MYSDLNNKKLYTEIEENGLLTYMLVFKPKDILSNTYYQVQHLSNYTILYFDLSLEESTLFLFRASTTFRA